MAVYQQTKPAAIDQLNHSQDDIQQNFEAIKALVDVDHETFANGATPEGKHIKTTFTEQGADPATLADEGAIYAKASTLGDGGTALFFRKEFAGTVINFTSSTQAADGWSRLPSGILLKWGTGAATGLTPKAFPVNAGVVPAFTGIYQVLISTDGTAGGPVLYDYTAYLTAIDQVTFLGFTVYGSARTQNVVRAAAYNYLAIGI